MEQAVISSPLGPLTLFAEDGHLTALVYGDYGGYDDLPLFREAKRQLEEYFAGQRHTFSLPMAPDGTEFQCRVWQVLQDIPYGTAISYRELADRSRGVSPGLPGRGPGQRAEPASHSHPLPPGDRVQRYPGRVLRRGRA